MRIPLGRYLEYLKSIKSCVDNDTLPTQNWKEVRKYLALDHFTPEVGAICVCFTSRCVLYSDVGDTLAEAKSQLEFAICID
jgi:hypothetical protein